MARWRKRRSRGEVAIGEEIEVRRRRRRKGRRRKREEKEKEMLVISDSVEDRRRINRERSIFGVMGGRFGEQWSAKYVATYWKINILNVTYSGKLVEEDRENRCS